MYELQALFITDPLIFGTIMNLEFENNVSKKYT